ncbi:MAG: nicotinate (nicotinamide) nucleotide adenylyltransferase [Paludibacteraceae bacterium]
MEIGIYGGSFNPVHFGHVGLVKWVAEHTDLDEVWMMVSPNNPLKDSRELADEQERLEGVRRAIAGIPHVAACDFEFRLPRPSYTANTLRALSAAYPQHTFSLIIGEDNLRILPRWREWEYIVSHYRIFVYPRREAGSSQWSVISGQTTAGETHPTCRDVPPSSPAGCGQIIMLEGAPYFDISSTEIRAGQK